MKAFLMYKDQDFQPQPRLPVNEKELIQDLELNTLFNSMAKGDEFLFAAAKNAILLSLHEPETIYYRQHILQDCLQNAEVVRDLYDLSVEAIINEKKHYWVLPVNIRIQSCADRLKCCRCLWAYS
jgi:hypothetical protein